MLKVIDYRRETNVSKIPALKILYDNQPVENLTLTRISIWNRGIDPIEYSDFAPSDRLRIEVEKSFKLLDFQSICSA